MTYREYDARRKAILSAYHDGRIDFPDMQSKLAKLDREYEAQSVEDYEALQRKIAKDRENKLSELESTRPVSTFDNWEARAEEALAKMKETHRKVKEEWAHAYIYDDKVKIRNGKMILATMSVLEARLLANEILSITNKQRRKKKMNEPICAVCGETDIKKLTMFNYGVCLCHRCLEISAHSFILDNAERKLKETEKKKESVDAGGICCQPASGSCIGIRAAMKPSEIIIGIILAALAGVFLGAFITGLVTILTDV